MLLIVGNLCFQIYKVYSNNQEIECTRSSEKLVGYADDSKLIVKLGRALRVGECRVKIFQLKVNDPEVSYYSLLLHFFFKPLHGVQVILYFLY